MIINTIIVGAFYMAFPATSAGTGDWLILFGIAIVADIFNVLTKPLKINIPVIGLADIRKATEALGEVTTRKDGKPMMELDEKDVTGGYL